MNQMEIFKNPEFGSIRTFEQDDKVLFCGTDIAAALGYTNPRKAVRDHTRGGTKRSIGVQTGKKADGTPAVQMVEMLFIPEAMMKLCSDLLAEREKNAALREENAMLEGKAAFYDLFIDRKHSTNLRTTAKELVVPERRFVRFLLEQRFVYRAPSGNVLPYAKPANDGLFCVKDYCNHGHTGSYTLVTPQGKLYFAQLRDSILLMI